jgi:hypothetical protein
MCDRQLLKHLVRDVVVSTTLVSKPVAGAGSITRLYLKSIIGMKVPNSDLRRRNVFARLRCYPADAAPGDLDQEAATVYIELECQQIDMGDVRTPKVRIRAREAAFAENWHDGGLQGHVHEFAR